MTLARRLVTIILAAGALAALAAGPAGARMVRLPHGGYANFDPIAGTAAAASPQIFDSTFSNLDYSGGPVMPSNTNYTVVWSPSNYSGTPFQSGYPAGVATFFGDLAAASGASTNSDAVATQYADVYGNHAAYAATWGGQLVDTDPLPANGCPALAGHVCITDAQIQTELDTFLTAQSAVSGLSHEYFLLTPPGVASCFDAAGSECSANADQNLAYCAYHSETMSGYVYANIPDVAGINGCDPFFTGCPAASCQYPNGNASDGVLSAISHEHTESITDPQPNDAWTDWQPNCTSGGPETCGGEIGDKCAGISYSDPDVHLQPSGSTDTPYNQTINGHDYLLQREWSNQGHACLDSFTASGTTASAAFTATPESGGVVHFDASSSTATGGVAEYVWQFNDGPGQNWSVETASPTTDHTFPAAGGYTVALTVMAGDGTSAVAVENVTATAPSAPPATPTAAFTANPSSATTGSPVAFDGSLSSLSGGTITAYSWSFGDGAAGSGAQASHTYTTAGSYTVTLTVTGSDGQSAEITHPVSVVAPPAGPPVASFALPAVTANVPAVFDASGSSDPDPGAVLTYLWSFGDGGSGTGVRVAHIYAPGTYTVTLIVSDQWGQSAAASQQLVVPAPSPPATAPPATTGPATTAPATTTAPPAAHRTGGSTTCRVPRLTGRSAAAARAALRAAHCRLGRVTSQRKPRRRLDRHHRYVQVVVRQGKPARRRLSAGARITLVLGWRSVRVR